MYHCHANTGIKSFKSVYTDNTNQRLGQIIRSVEDIKNLLELLNLLEFTQAEFEGFKKLSVPVGEESCKKMSDFSTKFQGLSTKIDKVSRLMRWVTKQMTWRTIHVTTTYGLMVFLKLIMNHGKTAKIIEGNYLH